MARNLRLTLPWFLLVLTTVFHPPSSARNLVNPNPNPTHPKLSFCMKNIFNHTLHSAPTTKITSQLLPFPKPLGFFPPARGIPIPGNRIPSTVPRGSSAQTLDLPGIGITFPARAGLQELEFGVVSAVDEDAFANERDGSPVMGKVKGVCVASSEDGSSHMVALTMSFDGEKDGEDEVRVFGVYRVGVHESHVAVIGGMGKFNGVNGYATMKAAEGDKKLLLFNVYLS